MKRFLLTAAIFLMSTSVYAAKPDWAGMGKPDRADVEDMVDELKSTDRQSDILERGKPGKGKGPKSEDRDDEDYEEEHEDDDLDEEIECELTKEECAALRAERKAERELERAERKAERDALRAEREAEREATNGERAATRGERGMGMGMGRPDGVGDAEQTAVGAADLNRGSEKQAEKKAAAVQNELDKGSEKGIEMRETKSKKWWQFWK